MCLWEQLPISLQMSKCKQKIAHSLCLAQALHAFWMVLLSLPGLECGKLFRATPLLIYRWSWMHTVAHQHTSSSLAGVHSASKVVMPCLSCWSSPLRPSSLATRVINYFATTAITLQVTPQGKELLKNINLGM